MALTTAAQSSVLQSSVLQSSVLLSSLLQSSVLQSSVLQSSVLQSSVLQSSVLLPSAHVFAVLPADEVPDVRECLCYLRGLWPRAAFDDRLPPVVMKHQLYSLCPDRTDVDHQVVSAYLAPPTDHTHPPLVPCPLGRTDEEWYYLSVQTGGSSGRLCHCGHGRLPGHVGPVRAPLHCPPSCCAGEVPGCQRDPGRADGGEVLREGHLVSPEASCNCGGPSTHLTLLLPPACLLCQ